LPEAAHETDTSRRDLPLMTTTRVRIRAIHERDRMFLYDLMTSPEAGGRVRFGGATPSPEKVATSLWESVLAQFVIEGVPSEEPFGLLAITSPNFRDGFAYISALGAPAVQGTGLIAEGVLLGFHYAFSTWPFRKIYMETGEDSYDGFRSGLGTFFVEEGRLRQHVFWNGRWQDVFILAVYRDAWTRLATVMTKRLDGHPGSVTG
jgi:RimJ/RimL family protein N-acetyltransferase